MDAFSSFSYMKEHAGEIVPLAGAVFEGGAGTFINKVRELWIRGH